MVTRPVMATIARIIRLNCRIAVLDRLFWIGCKSAKMFVMGFLVEFWSWRTSTLLQKAHLLQSIFGEGIDFSRDFIIVIPNFVP